jgi:hypothetical protein
VEAITAIFYLLFKQTNHYSMPRLDGIKRRRLPGLDMVHLRYLALIGQGPPEWDRPDPSFQLGAFTGSIRRDALIVGKGKTEALRG